MNKYLAIINARTGLAISIGALMTYITIHFDFHYNYDLTMVSIAIIFPLVFTIRSAFRRREKALEYLSRFKAGLITVDACFQENRKITPESKEEVRGTVRAISDYLMDYLGPETCTVEKVNEEAGKIAAFIRANAEHIGNATALKIYRFMKDVYQGIENVVAIKKHRTPISIRAYCLLFIYIYPIIYCPSLYNKLYDGVTDRDMWILYALTMFSTFILISLYNVQEQLENPFDQHGVDDIRLNDFRVK